MQAVLSEILDKVETIDELLEENDEDAMQSVIDDLWSLIKYEKHKLYLDSLWNEDATS